MRTQKSSRNCPRQRAFSCCYTLLALIVSGFLTILRNIKPYNCDVCQYTEDRDVNVAKNLKQLAAGYAESPNACGV